MGPQHPSTHGVLRVVLRTDGEVVLGCQPLIGNLHRCCEKILENLTYVQGLPYVDRMDYLGALNMELGLVLAVEEAGGVEVPKRAQYLRVIMCEINRVISHLLCIGQFGMDMGAFTPFLYMFREREEGITLLNQVTGGRLLYHYIRYGGVTRDVSNDWLRDGGASGATGWTSICPSTTRCLSFNQIFLNRSVGVAIVDDGHLPRLRCHRADPALRRRPPATCARTCPTPPTRTSTSRSPSAPSRRAWWATPGRATASASRRSTRASKSFARRSRNCPRARSRTAR